MVPKYVEAPKFGRYQKLIESPKFHKQIMYQYQTSVSKFAVSQFGTKQNEISEGPKFGSKVWSKVFGAFDSLPAEFLHATPKVKRRIELDLKMAGDLLHDTSSTTKLSIRKENEFSSEKNLVPAK